MWPSPLFPVDLVTFIEEILNGKLNFLCSARVHHFLKHILDWRRFTQKIKPFHSLWDQDEPCFFDAYVAHHTKLAAYIGLLAFPKDCHLPRSFQTTPLQWQVPWLQSCFSEFRKHRVNWSIVYGEANSSLLFPLKLLILMNVFFGCIWLLTLSRRIFAYIY